MIMCNIKIMKNSGLNVVIDLQLYFYKMAHVHSYKTGNFLYKEEHKKVLVKSVFNYIMSSMSFMKNKERMIFVTDSRDGSWRSRIESNSVYKKTRNKDYKFNIDEFFVCLNDFTQILKDNNLYHVSASGIEGDDLVFIISTVLYNANKKVVIMSADSDLMQLLKSGNNEFVLMYKGDGEWVVSDNYQQECCGPVDDFDFLKSDNISNLVGSSPTQVNPIKTILLKIMAGDKGDNVLSSYYYDRSGKETSFTHLRAAEVINVMESNGIDFSHDYLKSLWNEENIRIELAKMMFNVVGKNSTDHITVSNGILRNMRYVWLNRSVYDDITYNSMKSACESVLLNKNFFNKQKEAIDNLNDNIFIGTKYE
jgi:5'-3' exonuclease